MTDLGLIIQMFSYLLRRYSFLFYRGKIQNSYNTDNQIVRLFLTDLRASLISRPYVIYEHYSYHCSQSRETPCAFDALLYDHEKEICCQGQRHHFQIRKLGNRTTTWNITRFVDEIFRELLAYLKYCKRIRDANIYGP